MLPIRLGSFSGLNFLIEQGSSWLFKHPRGLMRGWWEGLRGGDQTRPQNDENLRRNNNPNNIYPETYAPWDYIWPNTLKQTPLPLGNQSLNRIGGHYQYLAPSIKSIEDTAQMLPDDMKKTNSKTSYCYGRDTLTRQYLVFVPTIHALYNIAPCGVMNTNIAS